MATQNRFRFARLSLSIPDFISLVEEQAGSSPFPGSSPSPRGGRGYPLVVKVVSVEAGYQASCPLLSTNALLYVSAAEVRQRVAFCSHDNGRHVTVPLHTADKYNIIYRGGTKGPSMYLKDLVKLTSREELLVTMTDNPEMRLSPAQGAEPTTYGPLRLVGVYEEAGLVCQPISNSLELGESVVWVSVNSPVQLDQAEGLVMSTAQNFSQCLENLQGKRAGTQHPIQDDMVLLAGTPPSLSDVTRTAHATRLYHVRANAAQPSLRNDVTNNQQRAAIPSMTSRAANGLAVAAQGESTTRGSEKPRPEALDKPRPVVSIVRRPSIAVDSIRAEDNPNTQGLGDGLTTGRWPAKQTAVPATVDGTASSFTAASVFKIPALPPVVLSKAASQMGSSRISDTSTASAGKLTPPTPPSKFGKGLTIQSSVVSETSERHWRSKSPQRVPLVLSSAPTSPVTNDDAVVTTPPISYSSAPVTPTSPFVKATSIPPAPSIKVTPTSPVESSAQFNRISPPYALVNKVAAAPQTIVKKTPPAPPLVGRTQPTPPALADGIPPAPPLLFSKAVFQHISQLSAYDETLQGLKLVGKAPPTLHPPSRSESSSDKSTISRNVTSYAFSKPSRSSVLLGNQSRDVADENPALVKRSVTSPEFRTTADCEENNTDGRNNGRYQRSHSHEQKQDMEANTQPFKQQMLRRMNSVQHSSSDAPLANSSNGETVSYVAEISRMLSDYIKPHVQQNSNLMNGSDIGSIRIRNVREARLNGSYETDGDTQSRMYGNEVNFKAMRSGFQSGTIRNGEMHSVNLNFGESIRIHNQMAASGVAQNEEASGTVQNDDQLYMEPNVVKRVESLTLSSQQVPSSSSISSYSTTRRHSSFLMPPAPEPSPIVLDQELIPLDHDPSDEREIDEKATTRADVNGNYMSARGMKKSIRAFSSLFGRKSIKDNNLVKKKKPVVEDIYEEIQEVDTGPMTWQDEGGDLQKVSGQKEAVGLEKAETESRVSGQSDTKTVSSSDSSESGVRWASLGDVPLDLTSLSIADIATCLRMLKMEKHAQRFARKDVDGALLASMDRTLLVNTFKLSQFDANKLVQFKNGWRPQRV